MIILQVCAYAAPYEGNFIKSLKALEEELIKKGHRQIYIFPENASRLAWCKDLEKKSEVYYLPLSKARIKIETYRKLKYIILKHPDIGIIHSHFELYDIPVSLVAPKKVKVFWHLHDALEMYDDLKNRAIHKLQYGLLYKQAILLSVSQKHMQYVINQGFPEKRAFYLPNGLDTNRISLVNDNTTKKKYDFLIFGWDYKRKGVDLCVEAVNRLEHKVKVAVIGSENTQNIIRSSCDGSTDAFKVISPQKDINALYSMCGCFLHISRAEGLSYALLEAAYAGLPVICSDIAENRFASDFPSVTMIENENIEMIAEAMRLQLESPNIAPQLVAQTRLMIEEKYSLNCWIKNITQQYGI